MPYFPFILLLAVPPKCSARSCDSRISNYWFKSDWLKQVVRTFSGNHRERQCKAKDWNVFIRATCGFVVLIFEYFLHIGSSCSQPKKEWYWFGWGNGRHWRGRQYFYHAHLLPLFISCITLDVYRSVFAGRWDCNKISFPDPNESEKKESHWQWSAQLIAATTWPVWNRIPRGKKQNNSGRIHKHCEIAFFLIDVRTFYSVSQPGSSPACTVCKDVFVSTKVWAALRLLFKDF